MSEPHRPIILMANPSPDVYGADLQMLESITAMVEQHWDVVVALPRRGALAEKVKARGARVEIVQFPVLRRANASPLEFFKILFAGARSIWTIRKTVRQLGACLVYVNTVTLPWWLLGARLAAVPTVCHVHEAETTDRRIVRMALNGPLIFATAIIVISRSALTAMCEVAPYLRQRSHLIYNGVPQPPAVPAPAGRTPGSAVTLAVVGRLSPRKAPHLAVETLSVLKKRDRNVSLDVCGTAFSGYEWYADQLRCRADELGVSESVRWLGYVSPIWPVLANADIVLAPSLREPFGNAVVEAQLSERPVVATAALGHLETIADGTTGLLIAEGDVAGFADAVERIIDDPELARNLAAQGRAAALRRFSVPRYKQEIAALLHSLIDQS